MPRFRCFSCDNDAGLPGRDFEAKAGEKPVCPECGAEGADVTPLVTIHFDQPTKRRGRGVGHAACDAKIKPGRTQDQFTGEVSAVTCAACKETEAYKNPVPAATLPHKLTKLPAEGQSTGKRG